MEIKKRFGVLMCAEDSEYVKKVYGGYSGVFVRMLAEEGETWDVYKVARGEFPDEDDLGLYDGFVITGSCSDAHGNDTWVSDLLNLLRKLDSINTKILGICFGHQVRNAAASFDSIQHYFYSQKLFLFISHDRIRKCGYCIVLGLTHLRHLCWDKYLSHIFKDSINKSSTCPCLYIYIYI